MGQSPKNNGQNFYTHHQKFEFFTQRGLKIKILKICIFSCLLTLKYNFQANRQSEYKSMLKPWSTTNILSSWKKFFSSRNFWPLNVRLTKKLKKKAFFFQALVKLQALVNFTQKNFWPLGICISLPKKNFMIIPWKAEKIFDGLGGGTFYWKILPPIFF